jgi:Zn ribbon nucleic-acid-binding protein
VYSWNILVEWAGASGDQGRRYRAHVPRRRWPQSFHTACLEPRCWRKSMKRPSSPTANAAGPRRTREDHLEKLFNASRAGAETTVDSTRVQLRTAGCAGTRYTGVLNKQPREPIARIECPQCRSPNAIVAYVTFGARHCMCPKCDHAWQTTPARSENKRIAAAKSGKTSARV